MKKLWFLLDFIWFFWAPIGFLLGLIGSSRVLLGPSGLLTIWKNRSNFSVDVQFAACAGSSPFLSGSFDLLVGPTGSHRVPVGPSQGQRGGWCRGGWLQMSIWCSGRVITTPTLFSVRVLLLIHHCVRLFFLLLLLLSFFFSSPQILLPPQ